MILFSLVFCRSLFVFTRSLLFYPFEFFVFVLFVSISIVICIQIKNEKGLSRISVWRYHSFTVQLPLYGYRDGNNVFRVTVRDYAYAVIP